MKGCSVYKEIKQLRELGLKKAQIAAQLNINCEPLTGTGICPLMSSIP